MTDDLIAQLYDTSALTHRAAREIERLRDYALGLEGRFVALSTELAVMKANLAASHTVTDEMVIRAYEAMWQARRELDDTAIVRRALEAALGAK